MSEYFEIDPISQRLLYPSRIFILKTLMKNDTSFSEIRTILNDMIDGNVFGHMRALEQLRLVTVRKEVYNNRRKVRTVYSITEKGRSIFTNLQNKMLVLLQ